MLHMDTHEHIEPDLYIVVEQDLFDTGKATYIAPLLCCGHYARPIYNRSSRWDFIHEADICPTCGEERQVDLRVQAMVVSGAWDSE